MRYIVILLLSSLCYLNHAQVINNPYGKQKKDTKYLPTDDVNSDAKKSIEVNTSSVEGTIQALFDHMAQANGSGIKALFTENARLNSTVINTQGKAELKSVSISDFAASIDKAQPGDLVEKFQITRVDIDEPLASVWADYSFFYQGKFHHCGVDAFQMIHTDSGWKIFQIADTRRTEGCMDLPEDKIHHLLDEWHQAAAKADLNGYFDRIADDGYYLGTDPNETWTKQEFYTFSKPYFDKGRAWDFTPEERDVMINDQGDFAWFQETLDTWMGPCRGSGILKYENGSWKIKQYNLAILVPNDKVNGYLDLIGKSN